MKKYYIYAISFFHSTGNGCSQISTPHKINTREKYEAVRRLIEEENNLKNVAIINYQLICKCKRGKL